MERFPKGFTWLIHPAKSAQVVFLNSDKFNMQKPINFITTNW